MKRTLYHGTQKQHVANIVKNGLSGQTDPGWFQLSTDFETALFHCSSLEENPSFVYVVELKVESTDEWWEGYPQLWPPHHQPEYSWYAIQNDIPKDTVVAVYQIPYASFLKQKELGFARNPDNLKALSKNLISNNNNNNLTM